MCLLAFAWQVDEDYPLVVCANRDEFLSRPTQPAHFWQDHPHIFAGRDLQGGGSWMGISRYGRFAAVTNIRNPADNRENAPSRGDLVSRFLQQDIPALDYCIEMNPGADAYNGFNLLLFDGASLVYHSNRIDHPRFLEPGVYAVSNTTLGISWPKTSSAAQKMKQWMTSPASVEQLAMLLNDRSVVADEELPKTGVSIELERMLSAQFIASAEYGTRCSTGFMLQRSGRAECYEISHDREGQVSHQVVDNFISRS